jgi:hypothetical protein
VDDCTALRARLHGGNNISIKLYKGGKTVLHLKQLHPDPGPVEYRFTYIEDGLHISIVAAMTHEDGIKAVTFSRIKAAVASDPELSNLVDAITNLP